MAGHLFAIVVPVYNVERYLDEFFDSLLTQDYGFDNIEVVLVNDGSTDGSLAKLEQFQGQHPANVKVLDKPNGGQASARNLGLDAVTADWVSFPDPDDVLISDYFSEIASYMHQTAGQGVQVYAGHPIIWWEDKDRKRDSHVLAFRFREGNSVSNLNARPEYIQPHVTSGFFRMQIIRSAGLKFDERLRTRFEDGKFLSDYWLQTPEPILALVPLAKYYYRQRADGSSAIQSNVTRVENYRDVPVIGYLDLLDRFPDRAPVWLENFILYDLFWLLRSDHKTKRATRSLPDDVREQFVANLELIMRKIHPATIEAFDLLALPEWFKDAFTHGMDQSTPWHSAPFFTRPDETQRIMPVHYRYIGKQPAEQIYVDGKLVQPHHEKSQPLDVFGKQYMVERTLWVPMSPHVRVLLDGARAPMQAPQPHPRVVHRRQHDFDEVLEDLHPHVPTGFHQRSKLSASERLGASWRAVKRTARRMAKLKFWIDVIWRIIIVLPPVRAKYLDAWILMDKDTEANDSAEQLFRWIREHHPEHKSYFVVSKHSADYKRLKSTGMPIVAYRSWRWKPLILLASHMISSHIDGYISNPINQRRYGRPQWRLDFLQHGVIKGDLSPWLNSKAADFIVTSTDAEYNYITGFSPYKFSTKEVRLTGLPRHDALLAKNSVIPDDQKNLILLAPTWRQYLVGARDGKTAERVINDHFLESEFAKQWGTVLHSAELREFAAKHNYKIAYLPHPNIQPYIDAMGVPEGIEVVRYADTDVQEIVCRTAVMVTDYSSMAFNAAFLYRPVVYFQFDRADYEKGHTEGKGYFEYERDGFGPVATTVHEVVSGVTGVLTDADVRKKYLQRERDTFPVRDGRNSERVFNALHELDVEIPFAAAAKPAPVESWANLIAAGKAGPE